jgi:hypothetical protein
MGLTFFDIIGLALVCHWFAKTGSYPQLIHRLSTGYPQPDIRFDIGLTFLGELLDNSFR